MTQQQPRHVPEIVLDKVVPQIINIDTLQPNSWNPNVLPDSLFAGLIADLRKNGFIGQPIICRRLEDGTLQITDGEHRYRAAKQLGYKEVPVIIHDSDEDTAKINTFRWNHERGFFDTVKTSDLIRDLRKRHSIDELVKSLGVEHEEMVQYLRPSEIPATWHVPLEAESYSQPEEREPLIFYLEMAEKTFITDTLDAYKKEKRLEDRNQALVHMVKSVIPSQKGDRGVQRRRTKHGSK